ncbi:choline-binding transcriptional repressor BetI [Palleronia caenipelagi]|uniref:HTH-type transcriptional regulator BetI n=1 Tax=Palleronia caenipelagi TaxID=2489174 RepID=A0A547QA46_9RHOB|nr:transcriptional regulator BetI [Palleronia caenipelagi]TRD23268.1 transcriptional regulator BetI [Palleronia caenipelagi]
MPKIGMEPIRRRAVVEAAIAEIGRAGSLDVTVAQIARHAGISSALVHHYFGSKDQVLLAAMRHLLVLYSAEIRTALDQAPSPAARVEAIVRVSFSPKSLSPEMLAAWLNFYVAAQRSEEARRMLCTYHRRLLSNLTHGLRPLVGGEAPEMAQRMAAMIDGIYLRLGLGDGALDHDEAVHLVFGLLDTAQTGTMPPQERKLMP